MSFELDEVGKSKTPQQEESSMSLREFLEDIPTWVWVVLGVVLFIGVLLILILIPTSYNYVEYNEYAFKKDNTKNEIDTTKVYTNGQYFWGPSFGPVAFPREYQLVELSEDEDGALVIFTDGGTEILIESSFQWFINPETLEQVYQKFGLSYKSQVVTVARAALKNRAPELSIEQYYNNRQYVATQLEAALRQALGEVGVELFAFQLRHVDLGTKGQNTLNILIQEQQNLKEQYIQNATNIRKQIVTKQQEIEQQITQIKAQATANAARSVAFATSESFRILNEGRNNALQTMFDELGMNNTELRLGMLYALGIQELSNANLALGTTTTIVNNKNE